MDSSGDRLFDVATKTRRPRDRYLPVPTDPRKCPECAAPTKESSMVEQSLFVGGGYGAHRSTTIRFCSRWCGWSTKLAINEINPRQRAPQ